MRNFFLFCIFLSFLTNYQLFALVARTDTRPWPKCTVPYVPNPSHSQWQNILNAMKKFTAAANIKFVVRTNEDAYISFENDPTWAQHSDYCGYQGIPYQVNIKYNIRIEHELGHVLGFEHEHERSDRSNSLNILTQNIDQNDQVASQLTGTLSDENFITNFDAYSIMIYWCSAAGKNANVWDKITNSKELFNGKWITMKLKNDLSHKWDSATELSSLDIAGIKKFYKECNA